MSETSLLFTNDSIVPHCVFIVMIFTAKCKFTLFLGGSLGAFQVSPFRSEVCGCGSLILLIINAAPQSERLCIGPAVRSDTGAGGTMVARGCNRVKVLSWKRASGMAMPSNRHPGPRRTLYVCMSVCMSVCMYVCPEFIQSRS